MHHEMPKLVAEHKVLAKLAGKWSGEETMSPSPWDPAGGKAQCKIESKVTLDGFCVVTDYEQTRNGQVSYRGLGIYSYDTNLKTFVMTWFDTVSGGVGGMSNGTWDGKTLAFQNQNPMGHSRYVYTFESDVKYLFKIEFSQDGKSWTPFLEGTLTKR